MLIELLMLAGGLALVVKGGEFFVAAAIRLAEFLRLPRVVVGSTLVSLATTTPELVVSVMAGLHGESGLAIGNAVGSCVCNIGLILGVTGLLATVRVQFRTLLLPFAVMLGLGLTLVAMTLDHTLSSREGLVLVALGIGYFVVDFWRHWKDRGCAVIAQATAIEEDLTVARWGWVRTPTGAAVQFLVGALIVVAGSRLLVDGASGVALRLGIPAIVVGLTVVAVGTSLPELVTAITSSRCAVGDLAVGNVLGANIANLSIVVGTAAAIHAVGLDRMTQLISFPAMIVVMLVLLPLLLGKRGLGRPQGLALLGLYGVYLLGVVGLTLWAAG